MNEDNEPEQTQIPVKKPTRERLKLVSYKGETYDERVNHLIDIKNKFSKEKEFRGWFKRNYRLFGFTKIVEDNLTSTPDFVMEKNGEDVGVELEVTSSNFIRHGHDPEDVDMVVCLLEDKDLPVKTLELESPYQGKMPGKVSIYLNEEINPLKETYKNLMNNLGISISEVVAEIIRAVVEKAREKGIGLGESPSRLSFGVYLSQEEGVKEVTVKIEKEN